MNKNVEFLSNFEIVIKSKIIYVFNCKVYVNVQNKSIWILYEFVDILVEVNIYMARCKIYKFIDLTAENKTFFNVE